MALQEVVWIIALTGIGLVALGFLLVILQAGKPADDEAARRSARNARRLQAWLFGILLVGFTVGTWATLRHYPIPHQKKPLAAQQVVDVVGRQWSWQITPSTVEAGSAVEFRVASADVNHGFALYSPDGRIVSQTQAMPGYTNKLLHTFDTPGKYTVMCLEYCGLGHAPMTATINVVASLASAQPAAGEAPAAGKAAAAGEPVAASGEQVYATHCAACHQPSGQGLPGIYPPLADNAAVNDADPTAHIHAVLYGLQGKVIGGVAYPVPMQPFKDILSDEDIAAVVNHERSAWGNHGDPVTPAQVTALRSAGQ